MRIDMPYAAEMIIEKLQDAGFEAYIVGGCVRDVLLGRAPSDFDITTSALPYEVMRALKGCTIIPTGLKHGTVTVVISGGHYEVTTFRVDGGYSDGRRPDSVSFSGSLREDLRRRDFTVNAMAYSHEKGLVDYFGGAEDLKNGVLRCVGDAGERFSEDYLRMLRAYRFAAALNFEMERSVRHAAILNRKRILKISAERIRAELDKLLMSGNFPKIVSFFDDYSDVLFPEIYAMKDVVQNNVYHCFDVYGHTMEVLRHTGGVLALRLCALFHDTGKPRTLSTDGGGINHFYGHAAVSASIASATLKRLKYDNATHDLVVCLVKHHDYSFKPDVKAMKRLLGKFGEEAARLLLDFYEADTMGKSEYAKAEKLPHAAQCREALEAALSSGEPLTIKDLAVNGKDIMDTLGVRPGKAVGDALAFLLERVIDAPELNTREKLLELAKQYHLKGTKK